MSDPKMKRCSSGDNCLHPMGCMQPATSEYFQPRNDVKSGLNYKCRPCQAEYNRQYKKGNPKDRTAYHRRYRAQNREKRNRYNRNYRRRKKAQAIAQDFLQWAKEQE